MEYTGGISLFGYSGDRTKRKKTELSETLDELCEINEVKYSESREIVITSFVEDSYFKAEVYRKRNGEENLSVPCDIIYGEITRDQSDFSLVICTKSGSLYNISVYKNETDKLYVCDSMDPANHRGLFVKLTAPSGDSNVIDLTSFDYFPSKNILQLTKHFYSGKIDGDNVLASFRTLFRGYMEATLDIKRGDPTNSDAKETIDFGREYIKKFEEEPKEEGYSPRLTNHF